MRPRSSPFDTGPTHSTRPPSHSSHETWTPPIIVTPFNQTASVSVYFWGEPESPLSILFLDSVTVSPRCHFPPLTSFSIVVLSPLVLLFLGRTRKETHRWQILPDGSANLNTSQHRPSVSSHGLTPASVLCSGVRLPVEATDFVDLCTGSNQPITALCAATSIIHLIANVHPDLCRTEISCANPQAWR